MSYGIEVSQKSKSETPLPKNVGPFPRFELPHGIRVRKGATGGTPLHPQLPTAITYLLGVWLSDQPHLSGLLLSDRLGSSSKPG